jgi:hypothetical protein
MYHIVESHKEGKRWGKVVPVLNYLSTTSWRRMEEWMHRSIFYWPRHWLEVNGQIQAPAALPPRKAPDTHWIGGWVDPRAGLDDVEKRKFLNLSGLELRPFDCPSRSQSLYRLRYPASHKEVIIKLSHGVSCFQMTFLYHAVALFEKRLVR